MANRQVGYGLSAEIANKLASKYSLDDEREVLDWISMLISVPVPPPGKENAHAWLKDGTKLCNLINVLSPGIVRKVNNSKMAFKQMENIGFFLEAVEKVGVNRLDLFQTVDLFENQNLVQVYLCIFKLSSAARNNGFPGPHIGVKTAAKNERIFSEETLREGRNIIGLQMGSNKVASQAGMTAYGTSRQMITKIDK